MDDSKDTSYMIAVAVIGMMLITAFFYFWLCVVSYFQLLKEIAAIEEIHTHTKAVAKKKPISSFNANNKN